MTRILILLLIWCAPAMAEDTGIVQQVPTLPGWQTDSPGSLAIGKITGPTYFVISGDRGALVTIKIDDGSMTFGENYKPDEAARVFWDAITAERKARTCQ